MTEHFWFNNPKILLENYCVFFPHQDYSLIKNLNSIMRLFIYYTILCIIFTENSLFNIIKPLVLISIITVIIYDYNKKETFQNIEVETVKRVSEPSNPVMNLSVMDYNSNKKILVDKNVSNSILNENITKDIPYNVDGESSKKLLERNFYTMPVTNVYNDQTEFAKWLYDTGPTCKENTINCSNTITNRISMGTNS